MMGKRKMRKRGNEVRCKSGGEREKARRAEVKGNGRWKEEKGKGGREQEMGGRNGGAARKRRGGEEEADEWRAEG